MNWEMLFDDIDWIQKAIEDPSYLLVKNDKSNMFELSSDSEEYIRFVIEELELKGYKIHRCNRFISLENKY